MEWNTEALRALNDEELAELSRAITNEQSRRSVLVNSPLQMDSMARQYLVAAGLDQGSPWRRPVGAHDAYPTEWTVTHVGKTWVNTVPGNIWEPGVEGWEEVTPPESPAAE